MTQHTKRSRLEWITFGLASLILGTIAGLVVYAWLTERHEPPALELSRSTIRNTNGKFYVPFELTNSGGETVESVQVVAELRVGDRVVESGDQQFEFLSSDEKEEGAFVFDRDPRQGELTIRVASYKVP